MDLALAQIKPDELRGTEPLVSAALHKRVAAGAAPDAVAPVAPRASRTRRQVRLRPTMETAPAGMTPTQVRPTRCSSTS